VGYHLAQIQKTATPERCRRAAVMKKIEKIRLLFRKEANQPRKHSHHPIRTASNRTDADKRSGNTDKSSFADVSSHSKKAVCSQSFFRAARNFVRSSAVSGFVVAKAYTSCLTGLI
jgi:hypothetical protein